MNKKDYFKLAGKLESGGSATHEDAMALFYLTLNLLELIESAAEDEGDIFGTEGWEHAIGWE